MNNHSRFFAIALALSPLMAMGEEKWKFAGENQGISFHLQITGECKEGSKVAIKLKSSLDHPVTVSFRLNDSDWRKTFSAKVKPSGGRNNILTFAPEESAACNPYIDQVYVESNEPMVTQNEESSDLSR